MRFDAIAANAVFESTVRTAIEGATYATATGTDTYVAAPSPAIGSYSLGQVFRIKFPSGGSNNIGASTLNLGFGAIAIKKHVPSGLAELDQQDITNGMVGELVYDGSVFHLLNPAGRLDIANDIYLASNNDFLQKKSGRWASRTPTQAKVDLALNNVPNVNTALVSAVITIDGGGATITTGSKPPIPGIPQGTIVGWELFANTSGSIVIDFASTNYSSYPIGFSVPGTGTKPTLSSADKNSSFTLTNWNTITTQRDIWTVTVDSVSTIQQVSLVVYILRS